MGSATLEETREAKKERASKRKGESVMKNESKKGRIKHRGRRERMVE